MHKTLCLVFLFLFSGFFDFCQASIPRVSAVLTPKTEVIERTVPLRLTLESPLEWHLVAPTLEEAQEEYGGEIEFSWDRVENLEHLEIHWPRSTVEEVDGLKTAYYEGEVLNVMERSEPVKRFTFDLTARLKEEGAPLVLEGHLTGVLCRHGQCHPFQVPVILSTDIKPLTLESDVQTYTNEAIHYSLWVMLGIAFLGGVILNFMPCVLPVLAMKVFGLIQGSQSPAKPRRVFLRTSLGIMLSFWLLASVAYFLKEAGETVGWGAHFQEPIFVAVLALIMFVFSLNLWGFFQLRTPQFLNVFLGTKGQNSGALGDISSGFLATLLATPCSAPFLGTAVGVALTQGGTQIFTLFTALGVGFAFPYLVGAAVPTYLVWLPKPGPWMDVLKKFLAVGLLGTAVWLGFVFVEEVREETIQEEFLEGDWIPYSEENLIKFVAQGHVVFVDVTARWCVTCHANHAFVLETEEVSQLFDRYKVVRLRADWTRRKPEITALLNRFGRAGIPFNVVFGPGATEGIPLPELLSTSAIEKALFSAGGSQN
ncbi:MAG: hypothetical protein GY915_06975 [bacterium]|nr:hypothetical protein [bacterium]